jgi:hypothetical protein
MRRKENKIRNCSVAKEINIFTVLKLVGDANRKVMQEMVR